MATQSTRQRLSEAEDAYHRLMCGSAATVYVDQSGERVEYAKASAPQLRAYILALRSELGLMAATPLTVRF